MAEAIRKELRRGGQVYYIHNRIETIDQRAGTLSRLVPDARIVTAHGKMGEEQLSEVWRQLIDHEIDILVCTTIIETGVDVPNCNTMIIEDADYFGLSQLYQLRGRIGRSNRRAFAYFTFRPGKTLTEVATKRLEAIREFTKFGSGFRIALRDLEIRGAGNILGSRQHGHMEAVGYDMYVKLLTEAIAERKGEPPKKKTEECLIDVAMEAHIPESYIGELSQRIDVYKKIAAIQSEEDTMDVVDELIDRFGEPPQSVYGLVEVARLRGYCLQPWVPGNQREKRFPPLCPGEIGYGTGGENRLRPQTQGIGQCRQQTLSGGKNPAQGKSSGHHEAGAGNHGQHQRFPTRRPAKGVKTLDFFPPPVYNQPQTHTGRENSPPFAGKTAAGPFCPADGVFL